MDYFTDVLDVSGPGNNAVVLLSMEGLRALWFNQKYFKMRSEDEQGLTGLERHEGEYDIIFIFGWTITLISAFVAVGDPMGDPPRMAEAPQHATRRDLASHSL